MVYLVLDRNYWGVVLKGIYSTEKDARKVQRRLGKAYLEQATRSIKERNENYKRTVESFRKQGRVLERWSELDITPEEYVNKHLIIIENVPLDEPADDLILYME